MAAAIEARPLYGSQMHEGILATLEGLKWFEDNCKHGEVRPEMEVSQSLTNDWQMPTPPDLSDEPSLFQV